MVTQLGEYLRGLRMTKGLTTRQVASMADCSQALITYVENGSRSPSVTRLWEIIQVLGGDYRQAIFFLLVDAGIPEEAARDVIRA